MAWREEIRPEANRGVSLQTQTCKWYKEAVWWPENKMACYQSGECPASQQKSRNGKEVAAKLWTDLTISI